MAFLTDDKDNYHKDQNDHHRRRRRFSYLPCDSVYQCRRALCYDLG